MGFRVATETPPGEAMTVTTERPNEGRVILNVDNPVASQTEGTGKRAEDQRSLSLAVS